jgi:Ca2+/Na+ antiporter
LLHVGTSLPNYVASKVAAKNGFGNQAVSNAFGSNTFNIMVGLGLPWLLYTSFGTGFEPYHGLRNEGIVESIVILALVLLLFIVLMFQTGFVLYKWHGVLFICLYVAYLALAIGQVYLG